VRLSKAGCSRKKENLQSEALRALPEIFIRDSPEIVPATLTAPCISLAPLPRFFRLHFAFSLNSTFLSLNFSSRISDWRSVIGDLNFRSNYRD
jgi:hypothetical protein